MLRRERLGALSSRAMGEDAEVNRAARPLPGSRTFHTGRKDQGRKRPSQVERLQQPIPKPGRGPRGRRVRQTRQGGRSRQASGKSALVRVIPLSSMVPFSTCHILCPNGPAADARSEHPEISIDARRCRENMPQPTVYRIWPHLRFHHRSPTLFLKHSPRVVKNRNPQGRIGWLLVRFYHLIAGPVK